MKKRSKTPGGRTLVHTYGVEFIEGKWLVAANSYSNMTIHEARAEAKRRNKAQRPL